MKGGTIMKNFAMLSAMLFASARSGAKHLSEAELESYGKMQRRQRAFDRGDHFYKGLSFKRVKGKWTVKK